MTSLFDDELNKNYQSILGLAFRPFSNHKLTMGADIHFLQNDSTTIHPHLSIHPLEGISLNFESNKKFDGLIINAGGYTHTSVSILDALLTLKIPIIELHISNIYSREVFRQKSLISRAASGIICGFGTKGYIMSINALNKLMKK